MPTSGSSARRVDPAARRSSSTCRRRSGLLVQDVDDAAAAPTRPASRRGTTSVVVGRARATRSAATSSSALDGQRGDDATQQLRDAIAAEGAGRQARDHALARRQEEIGHGEARAENRPVTAKFGSPREPKARPAGARLPARAAAGLPLAHSTAATLCPMERGQIVLEHAVVERRRRALAGGRRGPRRVVLRPHRPVPVPGVGLHLRRGVHDRGAPDPRVAGAGRPEPAASRRAGPRRRPQPARRRAIAPSSGRARRTTRGSPPAGPVHGVKARSVIAAAVRRERAVLARRRGGADDPRRRDVRAGRRRRPDPRAASKGSRCRAR